MLSRPPRPAAAPPASPPRPAARPSGPPQTFLAGAPLRPSSMAPFPSWRRRDHGGARLRQSDSRGGAEAGRAVRGAARRTARTASAAARGGPRARRRRRLVVLVLPRSSLSGAPLSWLWRRPVTAAMAAARPRGERAAAAACARRPHAEEPPLHGGPPRTGRGRRARRAPARPRGVRQRRRARVRGVRRRAMACARPRGAMASGGDQGDWEEGEGGRQQRARHKGGHHGVALGGHHGVVVGVVVGELDAPLRCPWLARKARASYWRARGRGGVWEAAPWSGMEAAWILVKWFTAIDSFQW